MTYGGSLFAAYWAQHASRLPAGYREVEYIESTGEQYIDTGYIFGGGVLDGAIECDGVVQGMEHSILGNFTGSFSASSVVGIYNGSWYLYTRCAPNAGDGNLTFGATAGRHLIGFSLDTDSHRRTFSLDGTSASSDVYRFDATKATYSLFAFAGGQNGYTKGKYKLWSMVLNANNAKVRDFVPCVRTTDSKPGMYDLCESVCGLTNSPFYINSGSGADFTWGELS